MTIKARADGYFPEEDEKEFLTKGIPALLTHYYWENTEQEQGQRIDLAAWAFRCFYMEEVRAVIAEDTMASAAKHILAKMSPELIASEFFKLMRNIGQR